MNDLPVVQKTAPERIWLAVSDASLDAESAFPADHGEICWSTDDPLEVCVPYVRADLATSSAAQPEGGDAAEDRFEQFVAAGIANSPEPLRELGEYLTRVLDEDEFPTADRLLLQLATSRTRPAPAQQAVTDAADAKRWQHVREMFAEEMLDTLFGIDSTPDTDPTYQLDAACDDDIASDAALTSTAAKAAEGAK